LHRPSAVEADYVAVAGDIGDAATARRVVDATIEHFGRVDTLVNNAGIFIAKPFTQYTAEDYAAILNVNLNGFFYIAAVLGDNAGHARSAFSHTRGPANAVVVIVVIAEIRPA
jgi:NAD(P)-dependent dehydrogenase (short-subunit alcohol dehydrogenase family)